MPGLQEVNTVGSDRGAIERMFTPGDQEPAHRLRIFIAGSLVFMLSNINRLLFLREVPIFKDLDSYTFLEQLADAMDEVEFPTGTTIFHRGESSQLCYILVSGKARVHIESLEMGQLGAGDCFGEMSLFDDKPRPASVTTLEDCLCLTLTQTQVFESIHENPGIALNIVRLLSDQIHKLNLCQHVLKLNHSAQLRPPIVRLL